MISQIKMSVAPDKYRQNNQTRTRAFGVSTTCREMIFDASPSC